MQSLESIPVWFADTMDITLAAAQTLLSLVVLLAVLLPTMYLSRGSKSTTIELVMLFLVECLLVGIGWLPFWILIATIAVLSLAIASLGTSLVTGE